MSEIRAAREEEIDQVITLMVAYCAFYEVETPDRDGLAEMARALIAAPDEEGFLLVAIPEPRAAPGSEAEEAASDVMTGFAACGWKWSSLRGARIVVLEDLFVDPAHRGEGIADALIGACGEIARRHGAPALIWHTQHTNARARAVYDRVGGRHNELLEYELRLGG